MSCHSKFAESPEARFIRNWKELVLADDPCLDRRLRGLNITSRFLTSSGHLARAGPDPGTHLGLY